MKKAISVLLSCAMVMSMTACGGGAAKPAETAATTAQAAAPETSAEKEDAAGEKEEGSEAAGQADMGRNCILNWRRTSLTATRLRKA